MAVGRGITSNAGAEVLLQLPRNVSHELESFVRALQIAFGPDLESIVMLKTDAENPDDFRTGVNLVVLLNDFKGYRADQARQALRQAQTTIPLHAMFLLVGELGNAASAFARKFGNSIHTHVVLHGSDQDERTLPPGVAATTLLGLIELASRMRVRAELLK